MIPTNSKLQLVRFTHHTLSTISNTGKNRKFSTNFDFSDPVNRGLIGGGLAVFANMTWEFHQAYKAKIEKTIAKEPNTLDSIFNKVSIYISGFALFASPKVVIGALALVGTATGSALYVLNKIDPPKEGTAATAANGEKVKVEKSNE